MKKNRNNPFFSPVVRYDKRLLLALAFASAFATEGLAQVGNSSPTSNQVSQSSTSARKLSGLVVDSHGEPLIGVVIKKVGREGGVLYWYGQQDCDCRTGEQSEHYHDGKAQ